MRHQTVLIAVYVLTILPGCLTCRSGSMEDFLNDLSERVNNEQMKEDRPFRSLGQWREMEGNYRNYYMSNFRGGPEQTAARHNSKVLDLSMFGTCFTLVLRFEAQKFGNAPLASETEFKRSMRMMERFADHNNPNSSTVLFFDQSYDAQNDKWYANPHNLHYVALAYDKIMPMSLPASILGPAPLPGNLASQFSPQKIGAGHHIAPDIDCTFININVGVLLYETRDIYPEAWKIWSDDNPHPENIFHFMKKYAYRPFSDDRNANTIDPRSYHYMRFFLDKAKREGRDVALSSTYLTNIDELRTGHKWVSVLFFVNNVVLGITADTIVGMFLAFDSGLMDEAIIANDPDVELIISTITTFLVYELETGFGQRRDLAAIYYTSEPMFYWMVARNLMHLERVRQRRTLPAVFETFYQDLKAVMTTKITGRIVELRQYSPCGGIYYDDFLGNDDLTADGKPVNYAEDRVFSTAMAANALLYTWSVYNEGRQTLEWRDGVPDCVKEVVMGCAHWLKKYALSGKYPVTNAFFAAGTKNRKDMLYLYAANRFEYLENGTALDDFSYMPDSNVVYGMEGYVEPEEYDRLMRMEKFGIPYDKESLEFHGFNQGQGNIALWSSQSMTYAGTMLAVSMADVLERGSPQHGQ